MSLGYLPIQRLERSDKEKREWSLIEEQSRPEIDFPLEREFPLGEVSSI